MAELILRSQAPDCRIYEISDGASGGVSRYIASTPGTRSICNDPFVIGVEYTEKLEHSCTRILEELAKLDLPRLEEHATCVLHILRGGLNFGLRRALAAAFGWNRHVAAFISAQRARNGDNPEDWHITEDTYKKVYFPKQASIVFGDVVATGTSLEYSLHQILEIAQAQQVELRSIIFFTIGGMRSEEILNRIDKLCRANFPSYQGAAVIYLEGRFAVPAADSKLTIRLTGTDLVRCNSLLAPEFLASQLEDPSFPLERCTIYDAGSRSFRVPEYLEDVHDYWEQTLKLAQKGVTFQQLLAERFPELDAPGFGSASLEKICLRQIQRCRAQPMAIEVSGGERPGERIHSLSGSEKPFKQKTSIVRGVSGVGI